MFLKNCWYCAGWAFDISQGKDALISRRIAGEPIMLYRKIDGEIIAMEDRCCHRQAPLSMGMKEGNDIRCGYHGIKFDSNGKCLEIPGQKIIPDNAYVRTFPVVVRDSWVWIWMGDPEMADPDLICFAVGPEDPDWNIRTGSVKIDTGYRLEIANLMDLSHVAWVHRTTLGGTPGWHESPKQHTMTERGVTTDFWMPNAAPPAYFQHVFPAGATFDIHAVIEMTQPCNFIMHFQAWSLGTAEKGVEHGQLLLDSYTCQAVTPRDASSVDYYYSWGLSNETDAPGMAEMFLEAVDAGFLEDKAILEAHQKNTVERPEGNRIDIKLDEGPNKLLWLLDKLLDEEKSSEKAA